MLGPRVRRVIKHCTRHLSGGGKVEGRGIGIGGKGRGRKDKREKREIREGGGDESRGGERSGREVGQGTLHLPLKRYKCVPCPFSLLYL